LADGFYERMKVWKSRVRMRVILKSSESFAFAGLLEPWKSPEDVLVHLCTNVTTTLNAVIKPTHNRMTVILPREAESR
jgi:putative SOS response-associated peptidase YedK